MELDDCRLRSSVSNDGLKWEGWYCDFVRALEYCMKAVNLPGVSYQGNHNLRHPFGQDFRHLTNYIFRPAFEPSRWPTYPDKIP